MGPENRNQFRIQSYFKDAVATPECRAERIAGIYLSKSQAVTSKEGHAPCTKEFRGLDYAEATDKAQAWLDANLPGYHL